VVVWSSDVVRSDPQSWANVVVWGSDSLGVILGDVVVWGATGGMTPNSTAWGNLEGTQGSGFAGANSVR
jgi:hypothetical protein